MDIKLREATAEDAEIIYQLVKAEEWAFSTDYEYIKALTELFEARIAQVDGQLAGLIVWAKVTDKLCVLTEFIVREGFRGKGIGRRLLEARPDWTEGKNILLTAKSGVEDLYRKFGFKFIADDHYCYIQGHPKVTADVTSSDSSVDISQGNISEFLEYYKKIFVHNMADNVVVLMKKLSKSGDVFLAKSAARTVGAVLRRYTHELPDANLCRLILIADNVTIAIKIISFVAWNRKEGTEVFLCVLKITDNIRAIADHFGLALHSRGTGMSTLRDACKEDIRMDRVYSIIPL